MNFLMDERGIIKNWFIKNKNLFSQEESSDRTWDFQKLCYNEYKSFISPE